MWRVVTHPTTKSTLHEIQTSWSLADLAQAHAAADLHDALQREAHKRSPQR